MIDTELVHQQYILGITEKLLVFSIFLLYFKHIADHFNIFYTFLFQITMLNLSKTKLQVFVFLFSVVLLFLFLLFMIKY